MRAGGRDAAQPGPGAPAPWAPTPGLVWAVGVGLVLLVLGVLGGRPDVALVGTPAVLGALGAVIARPRGAVWADVVPTAGEAAAITGDLHLAAPPGTEAVRLRLTRSGHGATEALVRVPGRRTVGLRARSVRTGPQEVVRVEHQGVGPGGFLVGPVAAEAAPTVLVLPRPRAVAALPLPARLRGQGGQHEARRAGEGGGLRDIHPFQPGDTPRRIDWRATARRSPHLEQLYVRRTLAMSEAVVTLVVDSRDDVGPDPRTWSGIRPIRPDDATSLDLARQAAATVAQGYLASGDRVGVEDLGVRRRALRPGAGRRQLERVVHQLALLRPEGAPSRRVRAPHVTAGSLVLLFSTFLDPEAAELARGWRRAGHRVVAVDVLPRPHVRGLDRRERLALRIVTIERSDRLADVVAAGAELVRWSDDAAPARLAALARLSHRRPGRGVG
ncbi:DUF58 domain-containing protein [Actinotalea sp. JY-7876]|uniref:DUF58 domain-containing protein n=1 Tax=Actinotalea sp. JY-7876 TaxID=2758442 RepID=UPI002105DEBD|nr:DUF58 domain-containing protein [Actinotalea sp. JY-7876]